MSSLMNLEQVAKRLGVSGRTVVRFVENGELIGFKVGKNWKFEEADVEAYIQKKREQAPKQPSHE